MSNPDAYVREINDLTTEIKRLKEHGDNLKSQRKVKQSYLRKYMEKNNLDKYEGITLKSITPRAPSLIKPKNKKKQDAIDLFRAQGIPEPEAFWERLESTRTFKDIEEKKRFTIKVSESRAVGKGRKTATKKTGGGSAKKSKIPKFTSNDTIFIDL